MLEALKRIGFFWGVGLLTTAAVIAVSIWTGDIYEPLKYPEQLPLTAVPVVAPFLILSFWASRRAAVLTAVMTFLVWALMWSTILRPDPSIVGANIGGGIAVLFSPILIILLAVGAEGVLKRRRERRGASEASS